MPSNLIPFSFESSQIRVVVIDSQAMFSARDTAVALNYANPSKAYQDHCKSLKKLSYNELLELKWENPNPQGEYVMPESDVYRLIVKSDKPEAERFERWVFEEVLPTIRKTGKYEVKPDTAKPKLSRAERDRLMLAREAFKTAKLFGFDGNMAVLSADNFVRNTLGQGVLSDMGATHLLADAKGITYTPTELGKLCEPPMTARQVNLALERAGLQKKELDHWLPTDAAIGHFEWVDTGKKHSTGVPVKQIRWFQSALPEVAEKTA